MLFFISHSNIFNLKTKYAKEIEEKSKKLLKSDDNEKQINIPFLSANKEDQNNFTNIKDDL